MPKNKLITVLSSLDADEWKQVRKYILMHTGRSSDVFRLFEYLQKRRQDWPDKWNTKQVHERNFGKINHKTFLNMMSTLSLWTDEWLIFKSSTEANIESQLKLHQVYTERGLYNLANKVMVKLEKEMSTIDHKNIDLHNYKRSLYHNTYYSNNPIKYKSGTTILNKLVQSHIQMSVEHELIYLSELYNWGRLKNEDFSEKIKLLNARVNAIDIKEESYLTILLKMISLNDYDSFNELISRLFNEKWDTSCLSHIIVTNYLIVYVMRFWQNGELANYKIITSLYDYALKTEVLLANGRLTDKSFHNIVSTIGGLTEDKSWSLHFIKKWGHKVNSKNPQQNISLAKAQCHFYNRDYDKMTPLLRSLKFNSTGQQVRLLGLQLIVWFEERHEHPEIFIQHTQNFTKFLQRHKTKLSPHYYSGHQNLIKCLNLLYKKKPQSVTSKFYNSCDNLIYRKYILNKIEERQ